MEDAEDIQELRIALVMNGGVSLAVWMGGVTRELDGVRRGAGVYGRLLALTRSEARIDVIAGASAGGINGAVLALAIARGTTVRDIRQLWMTNGAIDQLLRDPLERDAPSVLKGDGQLLARLHEAMRAIGRNDERSDEEETAPRPPLHLTITGTTLHGEVKTYPDRYGAPIPDVDHRVRFRFRRPGIPHIGDPWPDDFAIRGDDEAAAQLALAARSSASFPGAFEPSFVPVGTEADEQHPDMLTVAPDLTASRWMIDGGVLVNTPFRPALDAIKTLSADRPVRRILGYVVPNPVPPKTATDSRDEMPSAPAVVLDAMSRLPRVQSIGRELEEIRDNNRRVQRRRDSRGSTLTSLPGAELEQVARALLPPYVQTRRESAVDDVLQFMLDAAAGSAPPGPETLAEVRERLERVGDAPWLPSAREYANWGEVPVKPWQWGFAPVEHAANVVLDLLQRLVAIRPDEPVFAERRKLHSSLAKLRDVERRSLEYWRGGAAGVFGKPDAAAALAQGWGRFQGELGDRADELATIVVRARALVPAGEEGGDLRTMLDHLTDGRSDEELVLRRLLALDVVQRASNSDLDGIEQKVELVLMSADAENAFGGPERAEGKLAGLQAGHFGAFYKSSWRANDWMWGRLDGADRLVRTLLDPVRVQRRLRDEGIQVIAAEIQGIACGGRTAAVRDWLRGKWREQPVVDELVELRDLEDEPQAAALPASYAALRRRVQLEILTEEVPAVRLAVRADLAAETAAQSRGSRWDAALPRNRALDVDELIDAFKTCPVGQEEIADEIGSDYFTGVSTRAGAVIGSLVSGTAGRVKAVKPVAAFIRGLLLTLYLLGRGVVESSRTGAFLVALVLAVGGALVALFAIGTNVPGLLLLLGSVILMAGVLLALVRRTAWRIVLTALVLVGSAAAWYGVREWDGRPGWVDPAAGVFAVTAVALASMALGYSGRRRGAT